MRGAALAACLVALAASACGPGPDAPPPERIRFTTGDGIELAGDLRGRGRTGVALAHMFPEDRSVWADFAALLADEGYLTLNFDFRGYGDSGGSMDVSRTPEDVLAAVDALRDVGATSVAVIGASMGGTAALVAASRAELDAVITLSAPSTFMGISAPPEVLQAVDEPKLFVAAQDDGQAAASAQAFYEQASGAKRVEIVTGSEHGTDLLEGGRAELVRMHVLTFLRTQVPVA
ncbi:MAG: alpha/beta hydrolase [Actinomycetota bacterium]